MNPLQSKHLDRAKEMVIREFPDSLKAQELIELCEQIEKFGINFVQEIYPKTLFNRNIDLLKQTGIFNELFSEFMHHDNHIDLILQDSINNLNTINIDWLHYFVTFAIIGNTTDAAKMLNISSQALIKAISGIEKHLKLQLVERKKHFKGLTPVGMLFYNKVKVVMQNFLDLEKCFIELRDEPLKGYINIGWSMLWGVNILPRATVKFVSRFPSVLPRIFAMEHLETEKWLAAGEIDIGLLSAPPVREELDYIASSEIPYILVGKHSFVKNHQELDFIYPIEFELAGNYSTGIWYDEKYNCRVISESDSLHMALNLCEAGMGCVFVPATLVKDRLEKGLLQIVADPPLKRSTRLIIAWNKNIHLNQITKEFIRELKTFI